MEAAGALVEMNLKEGFAKVGEGAGLKVRQMELNPKLFGVDKDGKARKVPVADPEHFALIWLANFASSFIVRIGFIVLVLGSFFFSGIQALVVRAIGFMFIIAGYELAMRKLKEQVSSKDNRAMPNALRLYGKTEETEVPQVAEGEITKPIYVDI